MDNLTLKMNLLGGMNTYILDVLGDEDIMDIWFRGGLPDECNEDTLREIADDDDEFKRICLLFGNIVDTYT